MSDINKISSTNPYEVRINPTVSDRRQRETTVNDQEGQQGQKQPPKAPPKKPAPEKSAQNLAMEDMLDALRQQQNLEEDFVEYNERRKEFYRESNRQASEDYIRNLKEGEKQADKKGVRQDADAEDALSSYQNRIQDISRAHIQKLMKQKLENSTFKDVKRVADPDDPDAQEDHSEQHDASNPGKNRRSLLGQKLDSSRLRPELSKMLENQAQKRTDSSFQKSDATSSADTSELHSVLNQEPENVPEGRSLLENAISKLKNRLGGAHQAAHARDLTQFKPSLDPHASYQQPNSDLPAPIRTDLNQVQASIQRSRSLRAAADGTQYVVLDDADIQQILVENKIPVDYASVQAIKVASRRLQDSSYYFQRAIALLSHVGLPIDAETTELVTDTLRQFEKYQRPSIMNKLYRFLTARKYMQVYEQLRSQEGHKQAPGQLELGEALVRGQGIGRGAMNRLGTEQMQALQKQAATQGFNLPLQVAPEALKAEVQKVLKELALPASKVMVNQLIQSAQGNPIRAQALILQLAAKRSLHPDEVSLLQSQLEALSPEERRLPSLQVMAKLGLPLPENSKQINQGAMLNTLIRQLGWIPAQFDDHPLSRESLLVLAELLERTDTVQSFLPRLSEAVRKQPELWLRRLNEHLPRLQTLLAEMPNYLPMDSKHKADFQKSLLLALELPADRPRAMNRLTQLMADIKTAAQTLQIQPESVELIQEPIIQNKTTQTKATRGPNLQQLVPNAEVIPGMITTTPLKSTRAANPVASAQLEDNQASTPARNAENTIAAPIAKSGMPQATEQTEPETLLAPKSSSLSWLTNLSTWTPELEQAFPLAKEAILLFGLEAERSDLLSDFVKTLNGLLQHSPEATCKQLQSLLPTLQGLNTKGTPDPEPVKQMISQLQMNSSFAPSVAVQPEDLAVPLPQPVSELVEAATVKPDWLNQLNAMTPELEQTFPLAKESILLLGLQAERSEQLTHLVQTLNPMLAQNPQACCQQLERMLPALQTWVKTGVAEANTLSYVLQQIQANMPQQPNSTVSRTASPELNAALLRSEGPSEALAQTHEPHVSKTAQTNQTIDIAENPIERTLQRFYQQLNPQAIVMAKQQLTGASPAALDGFYQLHRLIGILDPGKAQSLGHLWEQKQIYQRLAKLSPILNPVLETIYQSPERRYLSPPTQQNQLIQALQNYLLQGRPEALQASLQQFLQPLVNPRSPIGKIKEQLAGFGIQGAPETLLDEIWALSEGSADRIDAMAILLRGNIPLFKANIQAVLQYIEYLPPQMRRQSVTDILLHLSPKLLQMIDQQIESSSDLGKLNTLLEYDLPVLPGNFEHVQHNLQLPPFVRNLQLGELKQNLSQIQTVLSGVPAEDLGHLIKLIDQLQMQLRLLNQPMNSNPSGLMTPDLRSLLSVCKDLLALMPQAILQNANPGSASAAQLAQNWSQLLQGSALRDQPVILMQLQDQLSGLFFQVKTLLPRLQERVEQPVKLVSAQPEKLAEALPDESLESIRQKLEHWGIQIQQPELLQQIQNLMSGQNDRLDAIAVLLKGQMPLLPAHIEIIAQYVKNLPPSERFTSISKILSFLSDELIAQMKQELQVRQTEQKQTLLPEMSEPEMEQAEYYLQNKPGVLTEQNLQASRLLIQSPLPQQMGSLQAISHLLTSKHAPQQWLAPLQQLLGQMLSLLPATVSSQQQMALQTIQNLLQDVTRLLQPPTAQSKLGDWLSQVGSQLNQASSRIQEQVRSLGHSTTDSEHWLGQILASLLGLSDWVEEQEPEKREQIKRFRAQLREQMPGLRQSFESLSLLHQSEASPFNAPVQQSNVQQVTQYLPVMLQSLGYPVEILIQPETEDGHDKGHSETQVQLTVQTHTLGQIYIDLAFSQQKLKIRLGVEQRETQRWLAPYLEAMQQKLEHLPWAIDSVKTYIIPGELRSAPVLAHHLQRRYGRSAIQAL